MAEANAPTAAAFHPDVLVLPLEPEDERVDPIPRPQLVRAAYPWVNYWRRPILKFMTAT